MHNNKKKNMLKGYFKGIYLAVITSMCLTSCSDDGSNVINSFYEKFIVNTDASNVVNKATLAEYCTEDMLADLNIDYQELGYDDEVVDSNNDNYCLDVFSNSSACDFDSAKVDVIEKIDNDWYRVHSKYFICGSESEANVYIHLVKENGKYKIDETRKYHDYVEKILAKINPQPEGVFGLKIKSSITKNISSLSELMEQELTPQDNESQSNTDTYFRKTIWYGDGPLDERSSIDVDMLSSDQDSPFCSYGQWNSSALVSSFSVMLSRFYRFEHGEHHADENVETAKEVFKAIRHKIISYSKMKEKSYSTDVDSHHDGGLYTSFRTEDGNTLSIICKWDKAHVYMILRYIWNRD